MEMRLELWCGTACIAAKVGSVLRSQYYTLIPRTLGSRNCLNSTKIWDTWPDFCSHQMEFSHQSDFTKTRFSSTKWASPKKFSHQKSAPTKWCPPKWCPPKCSSTNFFSIFITSCIPVTWCHRAVAPPGGEFWNWIFYEMLVEGWVTAHINGKK